LVLLDQQWYPLMITDRQMPVMDGIALIEAARQRVAQDMHIMILTTQDDRLDCERGYAAGADEYLAKKVPDAELFVRIHGAFSALTLRGLVHEAQRTLREASNIDPESGAATADELQAILTTEIQRAQRHGRKLAVITVGVDPASGAGMNLTSEMLHDVVDTIARAMRLCTDRVGRLPAPTGAVFAIVLPETGQIGVRVVSERLGNLLGRWACDRGEPLTFSYGLAAIEDEADHLSADPDSILMAAEHHRLRSGRPQRTD
jgi:PleD family two-component response regulator